MGFKDDALIEDSQKGQSECAHLLYKDNSCVGNDIGNYRQLKRKYLPYVYVAMQGLTVVYREAEHRRRQRSCFTADPDCQ